MRTVLICHEGDPLNRHGIPRWLSSFSDLRLIVSLTEPPTKIWTRMKAERRRSGWIGLLDALAFRLHHRLIWHRSDTDYEREALSRIERDYPDIPPGIPILHCPEPNHKAVAQAISDAAPDLLIVRCKVLLKETIFSLPRYGSYVIHPGICPEYRNAHGCFWAMACGDNSNIGATLLRIDRGIDTGPVFGYYRAPFDPKRQSHIVIQHRVVFDNLEPIAARLQEIAAGRAHPIDTAGRQSAIWGQPTLSALWRRKCPAKPQ
jgi:hypothetical protein